MLVFFAAVLVGLVLLIWSADKFVEGASALAAHYGMPALLIGILVMGFGTSAPEMLVSVLAALDNSGGLALGNAFGSNIANIAFILGATAIMVPIGVHQQVLKREMPLLLGATILAAGIVYDQYVSRLEGIILLLVFLWYIWSAIRIARGKERRAKKRAKKNAADAALQGSDVDVSDPQVTAAQVADEQVTAAQVADGQVSAPPAVEEALEIPELTLAQSYFWLIVGLGVLVASSRMLVYGATGIAVELGVSDLIIGLTIVAIGTSLPELAASIVAAKKGSVDMAVGNVIGSNMFNTLLVIGLAGSIAPFTTEPEVFIRDAAVMLLVTAVLFAMSITPKGKTQATIGRSYGALLFAGYLAYIGYLVYAALAA